MKTTTENPLIQGLPLAGISLFNDQSTETPLSMGEKPP
jgi:hypothetical protein